MRHLILLLCLFFSLPAWAQLADSGLYMDSSRSGEGIAITRNGDTVQFFFYTYESDSGCYDVDPPVLFDSEGVTCHEQRWYLSGGNTLVDDTVTGFLYLALGISYPEGIPSETDPFVSVVGSDFVIGIYVLKRQGEGWRLWVVPIGAALDPEEAIYTTTYNFDRVLFRADE